MRNTFLVMTSIAERDHPVLQQFAVQSGTHKIPFIVIGDTKSPKDFILEGCDFYSIERQQDLRFRLSETLPYKHYARKNLGYLIAMSKGAETIIETDDDNLPRKNFWNNRTKLATAHLIKNKGWVNIYRYFTDINIWPRGFALENLQNKLPELEEQVAVECPIQQGLADDNPDVDAIYRLTLPLPVRFTQGNNVALSVQAICPFNSQNTTWFKEAFPLMYLPSFCSFRMTDIWRSFVAQRIAWTCGWSILFHNSTVWQQRNEHNLMKDFIDEISGYVNNRDIMNELVSLSLNNGIENIYDNLLACYSKLIEMQLIHPDEIKLIHRWISDLQTIY